MSGDDSPDGEVNDRVAEPEVGFYRRGHLRYMYILFSPGDSWADRYANGLCKTGVFFPRAGGPS